MFYTCCWNTILSNVWLIIFILLSLIQTQQYHSFATPKFYHYYLINSNHLLGISQLNPTLLIITHSAKRGSSLWDKVYPVPKIRQHLKHNIEEGNNSLDIVLCYV
jgi:hypothetical protein